MSVSENVAAGKGAAGVGEQVKRRSLSTALRRGLRACRCWGQAP